MTKECDESGFTVIELLVALAILGGVIAALVGIFDTAQRLHSAVEFRHHRSAETILLRGVLFDALSQLRGGAGASQTPSFSGDGRRLALRAEAPRPMGMAEPVLLSLDPDESQQGLVATWRPLAGEASPLHRPLRLIAADQSVRFAYLAPEGGWTENWNRPDQVPRLLRVTLEPLDRKTPHAVLQIPIRALTPVGCLRERDATLCGDRPWR